MRPSTRFLVKLGLGLALAVSLSVAAPRVAHAGQSAMREWVAVKEAEAIDLLKRSGVERPDYGDVNAVRHARTIALMAADGVPIPVIYALSEVNEGIGWVNAQRAGDDPVADAADRAVDRYNNKVSLMIGQHIQARKLSHAQAESLVIDAYRRGLLITRWDDPRRLTQPPAWKPRPARLPAPNPS